MQPRKIIRPRRLSIGIAAFAAIAVIAAGLAMSATELAAQSSSGKSAAAGTGARQFESGAYYGGPRVWIGNLNGATAIGAQVERGLTQPGQYGPGIISGGVGIDYYSWSFDYPVGSYKYSVIPVQAFSNYHFIINSNRKIDPYLGLALVYQKVSASWNGSGIAGSSTASSGLDFAGQAGARYFLTDKFAVQGQLGFGYGTIGLGATWKF